METPLPLSGIVITLCCIPAKHQSDAVSNRPHPTLLSRFTVAQDLVVNWIEIGIYVWLVSEMIYEMSMGDYIQVYTV